MGQTRRSDAHVSVICYISAYHINYVPSLVSVSSCESIYILFPYFSSLTPLLFSFPMSCMKIVKTCSSLSGTELWIRFSNAFSFLLALFLSLSSLSFLFFFFLQLYSSYNLSWIYRETPSLPQMRLLEVNKRKWERKRWLRIRESFELVNLKKRFVKTIL